MPLDEEEALGEEDISLPRRRSGHSVSDLEP
jgi:hypothetical protein